MMSCGCVVSTDECKRCVVVVLCLQMSVHDVLWLCCVYR